MAEATETNPAAATDTKPAVRTAFAPVEVNEPESPKTVETAATNKALSETNGAGPPKSDVVTSKPETTVEPKTFNDKALEETNAKPSEKAEAAARKAPSTLEWRMDITNAMTGLVELKALDQGLVELKALDKGLVEQLKGKVVEGKVVEVSEKQRVEIEKQRVEIEKRQVELVKQQKEMIETVDQSFQKSLPYIREKATAADAQLFVTVSKHADTEKEIAEVREKLKLAPGTKLEGDELKNRVLNETDSATQKLLTRLAVLHEVQQDTEMQAGREIDYKHLPFRAGIEYAKFVCKHKDGVYNDITDGQTPKKAIDLLRSVCTAEMMARGGDVALKEASAQETKNIRSVVDNKINPMIALQTAMDEKDPVKKLEQLRHAAALADSKDVAPELCKQKIEEIKKQLADPEVKKDIVEARNLEIKMTAWESLSHAQGLTNVALAAALLDKEPQDFAAARDALLKASKDTLGANSLLDQRGVPLFGTLMLVSLAGVKTDMQAVKEGKDVESLKTIQTQIATSVKLAQEASAKSTLAQNETNEDRKAALLNEAISLGNQAIQQSHALKVAFGGQDADALKRQIDTLNQKPEAQRSKEEKATLEYLSGMHALAGLNGDMKSAVASWNTTVGNGAAALSLLSDLEQNNPEYFAGKPDGFNAQYKDMKDTAQSVATDREIDEMSWYNPWKHCRRLGKFCTDNWKVLAFGAACLAAVVVTAATFGAGAPLGAAIIGGAVVGLAAGTLVGGGLQYASGRTGFVEGCVTALPYAAAGAAVGSGAAYYFAPIAGMGAATAGGFWATAAAGAKLGFAGGALWNIGTVKEGYDRGRYDTWKDAALEYGTGVGKWTLGGAMLAPSLVGVGSAAVGLAGGGTRMAIAGNLGKVAGNGLGAWFTPSLANGAQDLSLTLVGKAGYVPRFHIQDHYRLGDEEARQEIAKYYAHQDAPPPVVVTPEVKVEEPELPSTYNPDEEVDLTKFRKK